MRTGDFGDHTSFELKETLDLPGPAKEEIDIEGLDVDGGYLWLIGSHSAKRKKTKDDKPAEENIQHLPESRRLETASCSPGCLWTTRRPP